MEPLQRMAVSFLVQDFWGPLTRLYNILMGLQIKIT